MTPGFRFNMRSFLINILGGGGLCGLSLPLKFLHHTHPIVSLIFELTGQLEDNSELTIKSYIHLQIRNVEITLGFLRN